LLRKLLLNRFAKAGLVPAWPMAALRFLSSTAYLISNKWGQVSALPGGVSPILQANIPEKA